MAGNLYLAWRTRSAWASALAAAAAASASSMAAPTASSISADGVLALVFRADSSNSHRAWSLASVSSDEGRTHHAPRVMG
jgi:hypothetical protein